MAEHGSGWGAQLARHGADWTNQAAEFLDGRELSDVLEDVRDMARRRPGRFLLGAVAAGVVAGRMTRAMSAGAPGSDRSIDNGYSAGEYSGNGRAVPPPPGPVGGTMPPPAQPSPLGSPAPGGPGGGYPGSGGPGGPPPMGGPGGPGTGGPGSGYPGPGGPAGGPPPPMGGPGGPGMSTPPMGAPGGHPVPPQPTPSAPDLDPGAPVQPRFGPGSGQ
ncbi:hypothetical protein [Kribbella flavida]|nr:hypothetical protein [Kribbella flavida]